MKRQLQGLVQRGVRQATERRSNPIEKIMLSAAGLSRQPTEAQIDQLATHAMAALKPLLDVAMSGNTNALRRVTDVAAHLCVETTMLACMHQEAANTVARERTTWPLAISSDPAERRRTLRLVTGPRKLPLSEKPAPPPLSRKAYSFSSPANAAVLVALKAIQIERSFRMPSELFPVLQPEWSVAAARLPDLNGTAVVLEQWFDVIWLYICHRHGGEPEKSVLRKLGEGGKKVHVSQRTTEGAVRGRIREALRQAFARMADGQRINAQP